MLTLLVVVVVLAFDWTLVAVLVSHRVASRSAVPGIYIVGRQVSSAFLASRSVTCVACCQIPGARYMYGFLIYFGCFLVADMTLDVNRALAVRVQ